MAGLSSSSQDRLVTVMRYCRYGRGASVKKSGTALMQAKEHGATLSPDTAARKVQVNSNTRQLSRRGPWCTEEAGSFHMRARR